MGLYRGEAHHHFSRLDGLAFTDQEFGHDPAFKVLNNLRPGRRNDATFGTHNTVHWSKAGPDNDRTA
jgi:hypothetical protein